MIEVMDEEKKDPLTPASSPKEVPAHTPEEYAAPAPAEEVKNPQQNAPKIKKPLDPKSKKGLIIACVSIGVVAALMTTMLVIGFKANNSVDTETGTTNNGRIIAGFYDAAGQQLSAGGAFSYTYQKTESASSFLLSGIEVKEAKAETIILPYYSASEESSKEAAYVTGTSPFSSGSNLFGSKGLANVKAIYAERYYEEVGSYAFSGLTTLTSFKMSNTSTSNAKTVIGAYAFSGDSALAKVVLPNVLTSLKEGAFQNCSALTSLTLPGNLTTIETKAFEGASALTSLTYLNSKEAWGKISLGASWKDSTLTSVVCTDGAINLA